MSEREEYTPDTEDVRETYERARYYLDDMPEEGYSYRAGGGEFNRWLAAHDRALREQIAREIEVLLIGSDAGRGSEVIAAHDSALSRAAHIARGEWSE